MLTKLKCQKCGEKDRLCKIDLVADEAEAAKTSPTN